MVAQIRFCSFWFLQISSTASWRCSMASRLVKWIGQPVAQHATSHRRHTSIDNAKQGAFSRSTANGSADFQAAPGRHINFDKLALPERLDPIEMFQRRSLMFPSGTR